MSRKGPGPILVVALAVLAPSPPAVSEPETMHSGPCAAGSRGSDPVLEDLVQVALDVSPEVVRAQAGIERASADLSMTRSAYMPSMDLATGFTRTDDPTSAFMAILEQGRLTPEIQRDLNNPEAVEDWATRLTARILLFDSGRRKADVEAARSEEERLRLMESAARRDVRYAVRAAYYDLIRSRAAVRLWEETVRLHAAHLEMARAGFEAGTVLRSDVLSIEVRLSEAEENLVTSRSDSEIALARLASTMGVALESVEVPDRPIDCPEYRAEESDVVKRTLGAHPMLEALDAAGAAASRSERARRRDDWPRMVGELRGIWHGEDESFGTERGSYLASVMLEIPIFDGGRSLAAAGASRARRREVEAARHRAALDLELAARTAHRRAREQVDRIAIADRAVEAAEDALRIIEERYEAGLAAIVELIEAERGMTGSQVRAIEARARAWKAVARVEQVAGPGGSP